MTVFEKIEAQQAKTKQYSPQWGVGEQLKDICRAEPRSAKQIEEDIDTVAVEFEGEHLEIGFNHKFLIEALKASETDRVRLQFGGAYSPLTITPLDGDGFLFLILPMRLKGADQNGA